MDSSITPGIDSGVAVLKSLNSAMKEVTAVGKDGKITVGKNQSVQVRTSEAVLTALGPLFREHGLLMSLSWSDEELEFRERTGKSGYVVVEQFAKVKACLSIISIEDGSSISTSAWGSLLNVGDKAMSGAQTVAVRIALTQLFVLPTGESDPDLRPEMYQDQPAGKASIDTGDIMTPEQMRQRSQTCDVNMMVSLIGMAKRMMNTELHAELQETARMRFPEQSGKAK